MNGRNNASGSGLKKPTKTRHFIPGRKSVISLRRSSHDGSDLAWWSRARPTWNRAYHCRRWPCCCYRVLTQIESAANLLERHPELGRTGRVPKTREFVIANLPLYPSLFHQEKRNPYSGGDAHLSKMAWYIYPFAIGYLHVNGRKVSQISKKDDKFNAL